MSNKNTLVKSATIIAVCTFFSKILGLLRDTLTASKYGAGSALDAFFAASNIPMILFITIGAAITTTLIPLYNDKLKTGKSEAHDFINNLLNFFIVITIAISIVCILFSNYIVAALNPGFQGEQLILTQKLTNILIPTLTFNAVLYIFNGVLQSEGNFTIPALVALPLNILIIGYLILFGSKYGVVGLTIVTFIATFTQIIPQILHMKRHGFKYKFKIDIKDETLRTMGIMLIPVILGTGVQQINSFIERAVATRFSVGSLSALSYAYRVFALIVDIFVVTIATLIYPKMARQTASDMIDDMKNTLTSSISALIVFILPISLIVMVQSKPIIYVLFERGAFNRSATDITSRVLLFYSIGLLAFGVRDFICKAYYTLKDTKTPMINSAFALVINVILVFTFQHLFGLSGVALANATSMYIACILLYISLIRKIGSIQSKSIMVTTVKTSIASIIMVGFIYYTNIFLNITYTSTIKVFLKISISSVLGILVFLIVGFLIKLDEIHKIKELILAKGR